MAHQRGDVDSQANLRSRLPVPLQVLPCPRNGITEDTVECFTQRFCSFGRDGEWAVATISGYFRGDSLQNLAEAVGFRQQGQIRMGMDVYETGSHHLAGCIDHPISGRITQIPDVGNDFIPDAQVGLVCPGPGTVHQRSITD